MVPVLQPALRYLGRQTGDRPFLLAPEGRFYDEMIPRDHRTHQAQQSRPLSQLSAPALLGTSILIINALASGHPCLASSVLMLR